MGVPKFFRWVTDRYPSILSGPINGPPTTSNVDNLYLDMNGVIHECSHTDADLSEDLPFQVIVENIFNEIRRIFNIVQPMRQIYIAVDGVAPRAKLNQQRARRFRSSRDRMKALQDTGATSSFDSNCITPGTEFMTNLSVALRAFIEHMLRTDPMWRNLKVHFSGAEVPGEGEHKIVSFIRESRLLIDYQPNTRHCILGADADMIMLSLATHEPYFLVLRDVLSFNHRPPLRSQNSAPVTASAAVTTHAHRNGSGSMGAGASSSAAANANRQRKGGKVMNYVRINVLRECIVAELLEDLNHADFDHERVIDDFVFLTFLVGNDFLPHLPAINIGDDAFDIIFDAYKTVIASDPGYLVCEGQLDVARMELIFALIGVTEMSLYHDQKVMQELKDKQAAERREKYAVLRAQRVAAITEAAAGGADGNGAETAAAFVPAISTVAETDVADAEVDTPDANSSDVVFSDPAGVSVIDRQEELKKEYYITKFGIDIDTAQGQAALREIVGAYLLGLQWCLQYYSCGCTSWTWYYPYHYGPFLHDLKDLTSLPAYSTVPLGAPLKPFQQLLACLPAASAQLLPAPYHFLMNDAASPIRWFYPTDFSTDMNGKKQEYESTVLLPFIDVNQLVAAEAQYCAVSALSAAERARNQFGRSGVYTLHDGVSISLTERAFSTAPARAFAAELIPGTVPPAISIPGFPSKAALMEVVNYTKGYGKSKAAKKNQRTRANCYGEEGGAEEVQEAFPMPGQLLRDVTGDRALSEACVTKISAASVKPVLSRASTAGTSASSHVEVNSSGEIVSLRLVLDSQTTVFLQAVAAQIGQQNPFFHPQESAASEAEGLSPLYVNMSLTEQFGLSSVAAYQQILQESEILTSAGAIFGPVRGTLQPVGVLTMDNAVKVKFVDTSHLGQLEEFLCQRLLGNELLDSLTRKQQAVAGDADAAVNTVRSVSKPVVDSGVGFSRYVVIGSYVGRDSERFVSWLNKELYKLAAYLPVFTCDRLEYVVESGEGVEDVRRSVSLTG